LNDNGLVNRSRPAGSAAARWAAVFLWCGAIFAASSLPGDAGVFRLGGFLIAKTAHFVEYAILFMLVRRALFVSNPDLRRRAALPAVLFCALYALSDEWHQTFVPGRHGQLMDVVIDAIGALCAAFWAPPLMRPGRRAPPSVS